MKHTYNYLVTLLLLILLSGCNSEESAAIPATPDTYFPLSIADTSVQLQLALTQSEQTKGLMDRDSMPTDHGMLFLFNQPGPRSFWMRNTQIPLDLAYFDAQGRLLEIHSLYPYNENAVPSRSQEVMIVVETNRGWFARNNITPGATLDLDALITAVAQRGQSPANYQLSVAH